MNIYFNIGMTLGLKWWGQRLVFAKDISVELLSIYNAPVCELIRTLTTLMVVFLLLH